MSRPLSPPPAALLFDMDGVLVDTFAAWYASFADLFAHRYGHCLGREEFRSRFWGRDLRDIFAELGLDLGVPAFCADYLGRHTDQMAIYPDTRPTLAALAPFPKAVITNTPAACTELILQDLGIAQYFAAILTGDDVTSGKPDPAIVRKGCELLGCPPARAAVIGDHLVDVEAGRRAGCTVIGVRINGDHRIERLAELLPLLSNR